MKLFFWVTLSMYLTLACGHFEEHREPSPGAQIIEAAKAVYHFMGNVVGAVVNFFTLPYRSYNKIKEIEKVWKNITEHLIATHNGTSQVARSNATNENGNVNSYNMTVQSRNNTNLNWTPIDTQHPMNATLIKA